MLGEGLGLGLWVPVPDGDGLGLPDVPDELPDGAGELDPPVLGLAELGLVELGPEESLGEGLLLELLAEGLAEDGLAVADEGDALADAVVEGVALDESDSG